VQTPLTQLVPAAHFVLHVPHADGSLERSLQLAPQFTRPVGQVHAPAVHVAETGHFVPHAPQFAGSLATSVHTPGAAPQTFGFAAGHVEQTPLTQEAPDAHRLPQPPQLAASEDGSTQAPPQAIRGVAHAQTPLEHVCPVAHFAPQPPQLEGSVVVSTHAPPHDVRGFEHASAVAPSLPESAASTTLSVDES